MLNHTNALMIVNEEFDFRNGLFSGYDSESLSYNNKSWGYTLNDEKKPVRGQSLDDPRCVFSKIKEFFKRYDFKTASAITGCLLYTSSYVMI